MLFKCSQCKYESSTAGICPRCGWWMQAGQWRRVFILNDSEIYTSPWTREVEIIIEASPTPSD